MCVFPWCSFLIVINIAAGRLLKLCIHELLHEKAQFYGTYYNEALDKFGNILPLTTGDDVIRGWDACMMSTGKIQLAYCAADALSEPENGKAYGQLDLVQKEAEAFCDVAVNPIVTYSGEVTGGETIALSADVYNNTPTADGRAPAPAVCPSYSQKFP